MMISTDHSAGRRVPDRPARRKEARLMTRLVQVLRDLRPRLQVQTIQGDPVTVGERQLVPVARSVSFTVGRPGGPIAAGYVRNRPLAVLEVRGGQTRRIRIPDVTRRIALGLTASVVLLALATRYLQRRQKERMRRVQS
jgi:uncharacterized spore protein YtfJ